MKIRTLALTAIALSAAATLALASSPTGSPLKLAEVVAHMEAHYPGEVAAIQFDESGDKRPHYHVDMRFPASGLVRVDIDAVTLAMASRDVVPKTTGPATLVAAAALVAGQIPGQVLVAELDVSEGAAPHYDVDVRLPQGAIARLKVDPATLQISWRNPAIVDE